MQKNWNEAELNILKSYKEITYQEEQNLAKILKRSISSIDHKIRALGIPLIRVQGESKKKDNTSSVIIEALKEELSETKSYSSAIPDKVDLKGDTLVIQLTDLHAGKIVKNQEGEVVYNEKVFRERIDKLCSQVLKLLDNNIAKGVQIKDVVILSTGDLANGEGIYATQPYEQEIAPPAQVMLVVEVIKGLITSLLERKLSVSFYGVRGNHGRCFDKETKLLTINGYKSYDTIKEGDLIPTWNIEKNKLEIKPINKIEIFRKEPNMMVIEDKHRNLSVTPDHEMLVYDYKYRIHKHPASEALTKYQEIPHYIKSKKKDKSNISDNKLRLLGWILTDGGIDKYGYISIYQSKEINIPDIKFLLDSLNISYKEHIRQRNIKSICGRLLLKPPKPEHCFKIHTKDSHNLTKILPTKYIQSWMFKLSDRQVKVLLDTMIRGDGNIKQNLIQKNGIKRQQEAVIWGNKEFLELLQGLLVTHGIPCTVNKQTTRNHYYLQIKRSENYFIEPKTIKTVAYNDIAWCVNVDNHTVFTQRKGKPLVSGNTGKDTDVASNWDVMIYMILDFWAKGVLKNPKLFIKYAETEHLVIKIRGHGYLLRHIAPEQVDSPAGRVKINEWARQHDIEAVVYGHYHHFGIFDCDGIRVFRGGSIVGADSLSESMAKHSEPIQILWGVNEHRVSTFIYAVDLGKK